MSLVKDYVTRLYHKEISQCTDRFGTVEHGYTGRATATQFVDSYGERCLEHRGVSGNLHIQVQLLATFFGDRGA